MPSYLPCLISLVISVQPAVMLLLLLLSLPIAVAVCDVVVVVAAGFAIIINHSTVRRSEWGVRNLTAPGCGYHHRHRRRWTWRCFICHLNFQLQLAP